MFCPQCCQKQISEDIKFCSRCGFELELVSNLIAHDGELPQLIELLKSNKRLTKRMNTLFGMSVWLVAAFLFNLLAVIGAGSANEIIMASVGLLFGLFIMILSAPSLKDLRLKAQMRGNSSQDKNQAQKKFKAENAESILQMSESSQDYIAPNFYLKRNTTGELIQPPSVVEETTKFLK